MKLQCLISSPAACEAGVGAGEGSSGFSLKPGCYQAKSGQVWRRQGWGLGEWEAASPAHPAFSRVVETSELSSCFFPEGGKEVGKHETQKDGVPDLENSGLWIETFCGN